MAFSLSLSIWLMNQSKGEKSWIFLLSLLPFILRNLWHWNEKKTKQKKCFGVWYTGIDTIENKSPNWWCFGGCCYGVTFVCSIRLVALPDSFINEPSVLFAFRICFHVNLISGDGVWVIYRQFSLFDWVGVYETLGEGENNRWNGN